MLPGSRIFKKPISIFKSCHVAPDSNYYVKSALLRTHLQLFLFGALYLLYSSGLRRAPLPPRLHTVPIGMLSRTASIREVVPGSSSHPALLADAGRCAGPDCFLSPSGKLRELQGGSLLDNTPPISFPPSASPLPTSNSWRLAK